MYWIKCLINDMFKEVVLYFLLINFKGYKFIWIIFEILYLIYKELNFFCEN